ncbi:MAG: SpoIIE family protein phosphatase [Ignavibacteriaceae bacterium]|nr:SpoIIE family protein phosphatase [Ignavibacteriaceae bacterium]
MLLLKEKFSKILLALVVFSQLFVLNSCNEKSSSSPKLVKFIVKLKVKSFNYNIYLSGNNAALGNWNPKAVPMEKISDSEWTKTVKINEGEKIEFKANSGHWWAEPLDSNLNLYDNFKLQVVRDTTLIINMFGWSNKIINNIPVLYPDRFLPQRSPLVLDNLWKYHPGDNLDWKNLNYNDSLWVQTDSYLNWTKDTDPKWENIGWFRFHCYADSSIWNTTLAFSISQFGASEIYYNGKLLFSCGKIGNSSESSKPLQNRKWMEFKVDPQYYQLFAVRYSNYKWKDQLDQGFNPGFAIYIKDMNTILNSLQENLSSFVINQTTYTLIPLILFFIHLFLFIFYPKQRQNLFYALSLLGFAGITYFGYQKSIAVNTASIILYYQLNEVSVSVTVFFGLLTSYAIDYIKFPKRWLAFFIAFVILSIWGFLHPIDSGILNYFFFGITAVDIIFSAFNVKGKKKFRGSWIIFIGLIILVIFVVYQVLIDYRLLPMPFGINQVFVYGMLALIISMSLYLSFNFAFINKGLEKQLANVKILSAKTLEQERIANKLELERRILDIENDRKTKELESAKELQISLLPQNVPAIKNLDISCYMETAAEVGGDYYDFFTSGPNNLTAVVGDATGHGLKAGNMVIVTKGLLNIFHDKEEIDEILRRSNHAIKKMNLKMLTMCLSVLRINNNKIQYSSAGMPPLLVYRKKTNSVEQVILKAMPLGAFYDFPYQKTEFEISKGDICLMISDGLSELFDRDKDILGIERISEFLKNSAFKSGEEIVRDIRIKCKSWSGDSPLHDDLTIVVLKLMENNS